MTDVATDLYQQLKNQGIKYAMASYVDMHGCIKGKFVPLSHLHNMLEGSELYTGAALDGVPQDVSDDEVAAIPDPDSLAICPWNKEVAYFASNLDLNGQPFEACSRNILQRQVSAAAELGYQCNFGVETEFFIFKEDIPGAHHPVSDRTLDKPAYDTRSLFDTFPIVDEIVQAMNSLGWDVYSFDQEDANGQFETDFAYSDVLTMADRFVFFRLMANEIARKHGAFASFMPKPYANQTGSGAHYNLSLADINTGENRFLPDGDDLHQCGISKLAYHFIGGVVRHARAICAVIAPTVNSYKRLIRQGSMSGSTWAPVFACYGNNNRTNMLRIPGAGGRVECRAADISCNPYLGAAMMLAAGLEGIREQIDPGAPQRTNMYHFSDAEIREKGIEMLPSHLGEAVAAFAADPLSEQVFGTDMYRAFIDYKQQEWESYHNHVSDWEMGRYLKFF